MHHEIKVCSCNWSMSSSESINVDNIYLPTQHSTELCNFERNEYPSSNFSTDSLDTPELCSTGTMPTNPATTRLAQETLCKYLLNKIKDWFDKLRSYILL